MFFFYTGIATTEIYTLSLHDALPIYRHLCRRDRLRRRPRLRSPCEDQRVRTAQHAGARRTPWWHASDQLGPNARHTDQRQPSDARCQQTARKHQLGVMSTRVVIADDHVLVRRGLRALLASAEGFDVVAEAADLDATCRHVRDQRPD